MTRCRFAVYRRVQALGTLADMTSQEIARRPAWIRVPVIPGLAVAAAGVLAATVLHRIVGAVGILTWSVVLGAVLANVGLVGPQLRPGLRMATRQILRVGVVLLGFSISVMSVLSLGLPVIGLVVTFVLTTGMAVGWGARRAGIGRPRSILIAIGFAICGASAIAATERTVRADDDDVAAGITIVTICGSLAMVMLPLLQAPLGLSDQQLGIWAGTCVHEVGQVVAAAGPAGASAVGIAVIVKLARVLMLAPAIATVGYLERRQHMNDAGPSAQVALIPGFVLGFLVCVAFRSLGLVPTEALGPLAWVQTMALSVALFAMGTGVHLRSMAGSAGTALTVGLVATLAMTALSLAGVLLVT